MKKEPEIEAPAQAPADMTLAIMQARRTELLAEYLSLRDQLDALDKEIAKLQELPAFFVVAEDKRQPTGTERIYVGFSKKNSRPEKYSSFEDPEVERYASDKSAAWAIGRFEYSVQRFYVVRKIVKDLDGAYVLDAGYHFNHPAMAVDGKVLLTGDFLHKV